MKEQEDLIFALDIGTRTIVGLVIEYNEPEYTIITSRIIEHENRAMLDGQIHNVNEVAKQVKKIKHELENELDIKLKKVSIAAAGRALATTRINHIIGLPEPKIIEKEDVKSLEFSAVQKAKEKIVPGEKNNIQYSFVGYSVIEYLLDGIFIRNLEGQKGQRMEVKLVATFLPRIVIDSLLSVINKAELEVEYLTLEPIAAADIVIPHNMLNFNLALVDIGAGTSDIALTKSGSMIGYGMVPVAGDEITEKLAEHYLLNYEQAEKLKLLLNEKNEIKSKTILGKEITINREDALKVIKPQIEEMVSLIVEEIISINTKPPQAVLCIGGGSLTPLLIGELCRKVELPEDRVGVKDGSDLKNIRGEIKGIHSTQSLTPIGIAVISHKNEEGNNFYNIRVNDNSLQIFSLKQPTVSEALLAANIDLKEVRPHAGRGLTFTVNGELKTVKGTIGEAGRVLLNGKEAGFDENIKSGDEIIVKPGKKGKDARAKIGDIISNKLESRKIVLNGEECEIKPQIFQNGKLVDLSTPVEDGSSISFQPLYTIKDAVTRVMKLKENEISNKKVKFFLNGEEKEISKSAYVIKREEKPVDVEEKLEDGMKLSVEENNKLNTTISEVIPEVKKNMALKFNKNQLDIPVKYSIIKVNGEKAGKNYEIKDEDRLEVKWERLTVNDVLAYINYNLSPALKGKISLKINDKPAKFTDYLTDGDKIDMNFIKDYFD